MREVDGGKATITLGETAEEVAVLDGITREDSDAWGLRSQRLTAAAGDRLAEDLVPVGEFGADEVRRETSTEALAKLKPSFKADGTVTAGTASPPSDGASAIVVAGEDAVRRHDLAPRASGIRLVINLLRRLEDKGGCRGLATLCIGVGQGMALTVERR